MSLPLNLLRGGLYAWLCACLIGLAGCSGPTYKTRYYTLMADQQAAPLAEVEAVGSLGVGPVRLPEILEHSGIVSQGEGQQIKVAPYDIWAGDLKEAVSRVLADNLSTYLDTEQVWSFPWDNRVRPEWQVAIVLERFGGERGGEVELQAKWRLLSANGSEELLSDKVNLRTDTANASYNAYVNALNDLLNQLSMSIARTIANHPTTSPDTRAGD